MAFENMRLEQQRNLEARYKQNHFFHTSYPDVQHQVRNSRCMSPLQKGKG